tara:strand:+ start:1068 stop:1505 length:438 start_codon:yes stop_codon:yes gene_type:complete
MARKTLKRRNSRGSRKTRGARRMRGGALQHLMPAPILGAEAGADATLNIAHVSPNAAVSGSVDVLPKPSVSGSASAGLFGGKRRKGKKGSKKATKKAAKKSGKKRKVNGFFSAMIKAKKSGAPSFSYNGKTYKKHTKGPLTFYKR